MERVLLYYPAINIPSGGWLCNSLLYTDKVSSIFPFENMQDRRVTDDMRLLYDEGQYEPISVFNRINPGTPQLDLFESNYIETINSESFQKIRKQIDTTDKIESWAINDYQLYLGKLTHSVEDFLRDRGLINYYDDEGVSIDKTSAIIYMSMLSDFLARTSKKVIIPSTDDEQYELLAYKMSDKKQHTLQIKLQDCLPTPSSSAKLKDIVAFKIKRRDELLKFRHVLDECEKEIALCKSTDERRLKVVQFKEKIETEVKNIKKVMGDSKLNYMINGLSSLLDFKNKDLFGGALSSIGVAKIGEIISSPMTGLGAGALVLTGTLVASYRKLNRTIETNSYSYVYHAEKAGIVKI